MLVEKLPDAANLALGAMFFGQFLGERPFSLVLAVAGLATWAALFGWGFILGGGE